MLDDPLVEITGNAPSPRIRPPAPTTSHLDDLSGFAQEHGLTVGSTTGGTHNKGSLHYTGNAIDIKGSGAFTDDQVNKLSQSASERGLLVRDERVRPKGQSVWGGPHIHIEYAGGQDPLTEITSVKPVAQTSDPLSEITSQRPTRTVAPPKRDPFAGVKAGVSASPIHSHPVGMGDVQQASRTRDPSWGELQQSQDEPIVQRGGQPSRIPAGSDLRVMKGEQPTDRLAYQRQGDIASRTIPKPTEVLAPPTPQEPNVIRPLTRAERFKQKASELINDYAPGLASLDTQEGISSAFPRGVASGLTLGAVGQPQGGDSQEEVLPGLTRHGLGEVVGALAPLLATGAALPNTLSPAVRTAATFGITGAGKQVVNAAEGRPVDVTAPLEEAALGLIMGKLEGVDPTIKRRVIAYITPGIALDVAKGATAEDAAKRAGLNLAFALTGGNKEPELAGGRNAEIQQSSGVRGVEQRRGEARPTEQPSMADNQVAEQPQRFQHLQFGEVEVTPDQTNAGRGRVKVAEVSDPTKQHFVKKADMQGRGNARMIPLKSPEAQPAEAQNQPLLNQVESPIEAAGEGVTQAAPSASEQKLVNEAKTPPLPVQGLERQSVEPGGVKEKIPLEHSTTAAKKASMSADRQELDLPELPPTERKSWQATLDQAKEKGTQNAGLLADEVLAKPRSLNDVETGQLVLRAQEIKNELSKVRSEITSEKDPEILKTKIAQSEALQREFNRISSATKASGTEKGRALAAQKLTINQNYDLTSMVQRATEARGRELTSQEHEKIAVQARQIETLTQQLADAEERVKTASLQKEIDKVSRQRRRSETKVTLDDEFASLKAQFAQVRAEIKESPVEYRQGGIGLAALDPTGKLTPLIGKMARNRVKAGTVQAEALVDEIYSNMKEHLEGWSKQDVQDAISGHWSQPRGDRRSEATKQLAAIRSELQKLDVKLGRRSVKPEGPVRPVEGVPKQVFTRDTTRRNQLLKQEAELQRRMREGDYSITPKREPPKYTRETYDIQKRMEGVKAQFEQDRYKATRGKWGLTKDTAASFGNIPKTMKSMADISAMFRQGGFYALTHPIEGLVKPSRDMFHAFTEMGYRNVENAIKNHPKFDQAKKNGVEFTGIDKNDPNLSHREEGYLGTSAIGTLAKGKLNPLRVVKGVADFSERTFVSFLDSQRMHMYDTMTKGMESQGITQRNNPAAFKAIAKLINQGTGRGDLGIKGNQAAPLLNLAMFSPRLVVSRVQLLNNMFNPVKMARMPEGARSQMIKDNVKFLAGTAAVMGLATALGGTVNRDPDDGDFLKIRFGKTTYDTLTGLQQPLRYIVNMTRAATGGETYAGKDKGEQTTRFLRSKASPLAGTAIDYLSGEDFSGRKFSAAREARDLVTPLPASDFIDAMKNEGLIKGAIKASPTLTGIGVQTYDQSSEKATTPAEKLSRKFVLAGIPDKERTDEQIDKSKKLAELRARSRQGEDVTQELNALNATDKQQNAILDAKDKTRLQEDFNRLGAKDALIVYGAASPKEQENLRDILQRKTTSEKLGDMEPEQQADIRARMRKLGIQELTNVQLPSKPLKKVKPVREVYIAPQRQVAAQ